MGCKKSSAGKKSQPSHIDFVKEEILAPDYKMKLLYKIETPDGIEFYFKNLGNPLILYKIYSIIDDLELVNVYQKSIRSNPCDVGIY